MLVFFKFGISNYYSFESGSPCWLRSQTRCKVEHHRLGVVKDS